MDAVVDTFRHPMQDPGYYSNGLVPGEGGRPIGEQPGADAAPEPDATPAPVQLTKAEKGAILSDNGVTVDAKKLNHAQLDDELAAVNLDPNGDPLQAAPEATAEEPAT